MQTDLSEFELLPENLKSQIAQTVEKYPDTLATLLSLHRHYVQSSNDANDAPSGKKRKLDNGSSATPSSATLTNVDESTALKIQGVSVQTPIRKKLDIVLATVGIVLRKPGAPPTVPPEYSIGVSEIKSVLLLPIPEKTKPHWALIVSPANAPQHEVFMATITEDTIKSVVKPEGGEVYSGNIQEMVLSYFQRRDIPITSTETIPPNQSLIHVTTHRGSKDGILYFLPDAVFFGFKKPLFIFDLYSILSISYSSITKSTFNLIVKYRETGEKENHEIEFSMIDQAHFEDINRYVDFHGLSNESLAEERRAKVDAKAVFPDELIKASREEKKHGAQSQKHADEETNLNNEEFASEDDEDDADFEGGREEGDDEDDDEDDDEGEDDDEEDIAESD